MEKIYKIKFSSENNKEMFTHSPDRKWHILDEGKHFVTVKAKSKTDLRNQIKKSNSYSLYYFDCSYGVEGKDYTIKEVTDSYEKEPDMKKIYKIKFDNKKVVKHFASDILSTCHKSPILDEKKKSVIIKAKNKEKVRDIINDAKRYGLYYFDYYYGVEDIDYTIEKIADSEEEYNDEYGLD